MINTNLCLLVVKYEVQCFVFGYSFKLVTVHICTSVNITAFGDTW
jgi:hypothetical protein